MALTADYISEFAEVFCVDFEEVVRPHRARKQEGQKEELHDGDLCLIKTKGGQVTACRFEKDTLSFNPQSCRIEGDRVKVGHEPFIVLANLGKVD